MLFTGKGGVGKTTAAAATAVALADQGRRVLVVSTDPASNLDDVLNVAVGRVPTPVPRVHGLFAWNLDPEAAAEAYREGVLGPLRGVVPDDELATVREQISGHCTVEVAAFDEFSNLIGTPGAAAEFDHVVFDTAPTGHTLRLLSLPAAWSDYIADSPEGASCLGPLATLHAKREMYAATVEALGDPAQTKVVLVALAEATPVQEAAELQEDLRRAGIEPYGWVVNGSLAASRTTDPLLRRRAALEQRHLARVRDDLATRAYLVPWSTDPAGIHERLDRL